LARLTLGNNVVGDMVSMKRWLVAMAALVIGGGVSTALLVMTDPARSSIEVYVAARDLPAGAALGADAVALDRVTVGSGRSLLFGRGDASALAVLRASHDLSSGQLIQRSDVMDSTSFADRRLVFLPVKDVPAAGPGSKVDILVIAGTAAQPTVFPFALGVEVRATVSGGLVVVVGTKQAAAFVYAANVMHLAAVMADAGAAGGTEGAISTPDQAMAAAAQP
jgi:hypothetical protein